uniref:Uncharacterized protein n=1 Tax=Acrobeloides nanus TaxID=290746 RepID=A0A914DAF8_9BILA
MLSGQPTVRVDQVSESTNCPTTTLIQGRNHFELARYGFNIVLISRNQSKLDGVKQEILRKTPNVEVLTILFDFTNTNLADYEEKIFKQLNRLDVGVLVNNVGKYVEYPNRFDKIAGGIKTWTDITLINTLPVTLLTFEVLKQMIPRNAGIVINISSSSSYHHIRYWSVYSATKKFVSHFTHVLSKEFNNTGIVFQVAYIFALPGLMADFFMDKINLITRKRAIRRNQKVAIKKDSN